MADRQPAEQHFEYTLAEMICKRGLASTLERLFRGVVSGGDFFDSADPG
jgi:hypothetical protein